MLYLFSQPCGPLVGHKGIAHTNQVQYTCWAIIQDIIFELHHVIIFIFRFHRIIQTVIGDSQQI